MLSTNLFSTIASEYMSLVLTAAPTVEPVTLADAKAYARIDGSTEDSFLMGLITTSRLQIEAALDLALLTQDWTWTLDASPVQPIIELPIRPVQSISAVAVTAAGGSANVVSPDGYALDGHSSPPRIIAVNGHWPALTPGLSSIEISFTAGFGDHPSDVPPPIQHALLMLVAHWYENREPAVGANTSVKLPDAVSTALLPYRLMRL